jgi:hypothetical protein
VASSEYRQDSPYGVVRLSDGTYLSIDDPTYQEWVALGNSPCVPIPDISPRQFRQGLNSIGLRLTVETTIATLDQNIKDWYEYAQTFQHNHPVLLAMAQTLGISQEQIDTLFLAWSKL